MKRITKISLIGAGTLAMILTISGCNHFSSPENRAEWMVDRINNKLELTDVQQTKLKALSEEMLSSRKAMKLKFSDSHNQVAALFEQTTLDQNKALGILQSHTQMIEEQAPVMISAFANFYDSLDIEQQAEVREFMQEHKNRRHRGPRVFSGGH